MLLNPTSESRANVPKPAVQKYSFRTEDLQTLNFHGSLSSSLPVFLWRVTYGFSCQGVGITSAFSLARGFVPF